MAIDPKQATIGGRQVPPDVLQSIHAASAKTGVDFKFLLAQASLESGFHADITTRRSSASGLFQFTNQTWLNMVRDHGRQYGHSDLASAITVQANGKLGVDDKAVEQKILDLRSDVDLSAHLAAELTKGNAAQLERALGRKPSPADLHLSLLLGPTGAIRFLKAHEADGATAAAALVPAAARQNPTIFFDSGHTPKTVAAVYQRIEERLAGPLRQVAALERAEQKAAITQVAAVAPEPVPLKQAPGLVAPTQVAAAPPPAAEPVPLKPGVGLLASLTTPPPPRKG
jgi:hypothetical protein